MIRALTEYQNLRSNENFFMTSFQDLYPLTLEEKNSIAVCSKEVDILDLYDLYYILHILM